MATLRLAMLTKGKAFGQDCLIPGRFQHWRANKAAFSLTFLQTSVRLSLTFLQTLGMSLSHLPSDLATDGSVAVRSACILLWTAFSPRTSPLWLRLLSHTPPLLSPLPRGPLIPASQA